MQQRQRRRPPARVQADGHRLRTQGRRCGHTRRHHLRRQRHQHPQQVGLRRVLLLFRNQQLLIRHGTRSRECGDEQRQGESSRRLHRELAIRPQALLALGGQQALVLRLRALHGRGQRKDGRRARDHLLVRRCERQQDEAHQLRGQRCLLPRHQLLRHRHARRPERPALGHRRPWRALRQRRHRQIPQRLHLFPDVPRPGPSAALHHLHRGLQQQRRGNRARRMAAPTLRHRDEAARQEREDRQPVRAGHPRAEQHGGFRPTMGQQDGHRWHQRQLARLRPHEQPQHRYQCQRQRRQPRQRLGHPYRRDQRHHQPADEQPRHPRHPQGPNRPRQWRHRHEAHHRHRGVAARHTLDQQRHGRKGSPPGRRDHTYGHAGRRTGPARRTLLPRQPEHQG